VQPGLETVDHLVYATPDLSLGIQAIEALTGVRAKPGGSHPGMGTRNALVSLGPSRYLEIIGPDPAQEDYRKPRVFHVDTVEQPKLVTWAARAVDIAPLAARSLPGGIRPGSALAGRRTRPDGTVLSWQLTDPYVEIADGIVPFFIDWGESTHPSTDAPPGARLVGLVAGHPAPRRVKACFDALGLTIPVVSSPVPRLSASIETGDGVITLQ
jgi:hypothetical protein